MECSYTTNQTNQQIIRDCMYSAEELKHLYSLQVYDKTRLDLLCKIRDVPITPEMINKISRKVKKEPYQRPFVRKYSAERDKHTLKIENKAIEIRFD